MKDDLDIVEHRMVSAALRVNMIHDEMIRMSQGAEERKLIQKFEEYVFSTRP